MLRTAFLRANPGSDWLSCVRAMARTPDGRSAITGFHRAVAIASYNAAKARITSELLARHHDDKTLVFTARAIDAYAISTHNLVPAITADIERTEREDILERFPQRTALHVRGQRRGKIKRRSQNQYAECE